MKTTLKLCELYLVDQKFISHLLSNSLLYLNREEDSDSDDATYSTETSHSSEASSQSSSVNEDSEDYAPVAGPAPRGRMQTRQYIIDTYDFSHIRVD